MAGFFIAPPLSRQVFSSINQPGKQGNARTIPYRVIFRPLSANIVTREVSSVNIMRGIAYGLIGIAAVSIAIAIFIVYRKTKDIPSQNDMHESKNKADLIDR